MKPEEQLYAVSELGLQALQIASFDYASSKGDDETETRKTLFRVNNDCRRKPFPLCATHIAHISFDENGPKLNQYWALSDLDKLIN